MKKVLSLILALSMLMIPVSAESGIITVSSEGDLSEIEVPLDSESTNAAIGQTLDIKARSAILMEPNTGKILYEANSDEQLAPASITKIMPLLLVMEAIDRGDLSLETVLTASEHACSMGGSQIWLEPGESMTVDDLLKAAVIASANDACVVLGEAIAGSEEGFVAMMNKRAEELGMTKTNFVNCTGLDADGHLVTAHDVAVMSGELIKHDMIKDYSTVWMDTLRDGKSELVNTNKLVRFYEGTTGLKTGTTGIAKYCLSATAERNGMELVAVVMAGDTSADRFNGAKKLLDYGFANFSFTTIDAGLKNDMTVKIQDGTKKEISVSAKEELCILRPKAADSNIKKKIQLDKKITAPVKKGDVLGKVSISDNGEVIGEIPIIASESADKLSFSVTTMWILKGLFKL